MSVQVEEVVMPYDLYRSYREWRTPPLWGVRDSAPYLHDGRAPTLEQAILLHDGQARSSAAAFQQLSSDDRRALLEFLNSLAAPAAPDET